MPGWNIADIDTPMHMQPRWYSWKEHIPATLPEDLEPGNIREPQNDDTGIPTPRNANGVEAWLRELGILQN